MNKVQREKAERLLLKQMLDTNPKLKEIIDSLIDNPNPELTDIIEANMKPMLEKARMDGINIGWMSFALGMSEKIKGCKTVDEAVELLKAESDRVRDKMGIKETVEDKEDLE